MLWSLLKITLFVVAIAGLTLGAGYLARLEEQFAGYLPAMAAGYNAGPGNARKWLAASGGPPRTLNEAINWIELIPFSETRNYVMRVAESLPIYRARLGQDPLPIPFSAELIGSTLLPFTPEGE